MLNIVSNKLGNRKNIYHGKVIDEAVYMVNLDICLLTFEFNDDVIYTLLRKYSPNTLPWQHHFSNRGYPGHKTNFARPHFTEVVMWICAKGLNLMMMLFTLY
jgi:hypothetical protein